VALSYYNETGLFIWVKCLFLHTPLPREATVLHLQIQASISFSFSGTGGNERCYTAKPNYISSTSSLNCYSTYLITPIKNGIAEKQGLCLDGLLYWSRKPNLFVSSLL
jgi:hypothetical protein